jgi:hypothetical protein
LWWIRQICSSGLFDSFTSPHARWIMVSGGLESAGLWCPGVFGEEFDAASILLRGDGHPVMVRPS